MSVITGSGDERAGARIQALVVLDDGTPVVQADIDTIEYEVFDVDVDQEDDAEAEFPTTGDGSIEPADCIFDELQPWSEDETGFNFSFVVPAACFPGESIYRVDFKFTPVDGEVFYVKVNNDTIKTYFGGESATT